MKKVTIIGSINVDNIMHIKALPKPGETVGMSAFSQAAGGKGANQAIASARAGNKTVFVGRVGDDSNGEYMLREFSENEIDTAYINVTKKATNWSGIYFITRNWTKFNNYSTWSKL